MDLEKDHWRPLVPSDYAVDYDTSRKPTGARKKTGPLRAARKETGEPSKPPKEERRQKVRTLREPSTPSQTEAVPQGLLAKDFSDFWKWRSSREVKRGPKGIGKPKILLQPQRPAHGPPDKFYMSNKPTYFDYHYLEQYRKAERKARRKEEMKFDEQIARQKAMCLAKENQAEKKKSSTVKTHSVSFTESANSANGAKRQIRTSGSSKFAECTGKETVAYSPIEHQEHLTEDEDEQDVQDEQVEQEDEVEELTQKDMLEIRREETDKYMRQKIDRLLKYKYPMHIIRRRQDDKINDYDELQIRALTNRKIEAKQIEISNLREERWIREMEKKKKEDRKEHKKERVVYRSSYHGPIYLESLSYEANTSDSEGEDKKEEETSISEAEETEEETEGENESATDNESEEHTTEDVSAAESEASDECSGKTSEELTDQETTAESSEGPSEAETSEASEASGASATEASEASASEADYSGYES